ncbi:MAG: hypothetical protein M1829_000352 [Trizodia sp. TS-e1964]|nr:MAG: hypothetical protein M1829_000352 [Trizodia sp. TS-e1964]
MVFKPFTHIARHSLKSFSHGYAQSVVAATQSSFASQSTSFGSLSGQRGSFSKQQLHSAFLLAAGSSVGGGLNKGLGSSANLDNLAAYYAAWQLHQESEDKNVEWTQYQFAKRIEWKPEELAEVDENADDEYGGIEMKLVSRSSSQNPAFDGTSEETLPKNITTLPDEQIQLTVEPHSAEVVSRTPELDISQNSPPARLLRDQILLGGEDIQEIIPETHQVESTIQASANSHGRPPPTDQELENPISEGDRSLNDGQASLNPSILEPPLPLDAERALLDYEAGKIAADQPAAYATHLSFLAESNRHAEIPSVFASMLAAGIEPTASAYNVLLASVIKSSVGNQKAVAKSLEIYSDMLRRDVTPDTKTYVTLIELLALRSAEVFQIRKLLEEKSGRYGAFVLPKNFLLPSQKLDLEILVEDNPLSIAIEMFVSSTTMCPDRVFPSETYRYLIEACALYQKVPDMINIYTHMESQKVTPYAATYGSMIKAFASSRDLNSAVTCYEGYKELAIKDDAGEGAILSRADAEIYAELISAYIRYGKPEGAVRFWDKIQDSLIGTPAEGSLKEKKEIIVAKGFVRGMTESRNLAAAYSWAQQLDHQAAPFADALNNLTVVAADQDNPQIATMAFRHVSRNGRGSSTAISALIAHFGRQKDAQTVRRYWRILRSGEIPISREFIEPTAICATSLIGTGEIEEGLREARSMFQQIRDSIFSPEKRVEAMGYIDEAMDFIAQFIYSTKIKMPGNLSMLMYRMMLENGGIVKAVSQKLLHMLDSQEIHSLDWDDLALLMEAQAKIIVKADLASLDPHHAARFQVVFERIIRNDIPLAQQVASLLVQTLSALGRIDLLHQWQSRTLRPQSNIRRAQAGITRIPATLAAPNTDLVDPHGALTDFRGSSAIAEELDNRGTPSELTRLLAAMDRLRVIRQSGRHPKYHTYARLIYTAARVEPKIVHQVFAMAQQDVPLMHQYRLAREGWVSILDSMVSASLTSGDRSMAQRYHQQLNDLGAAPSANTYGLYITTMSDSSPTYDEASEAVNIFTRAKSEGVEPSSFLYNALIGKLGKARRIDDCLFYYSQMRERGIKPTSITYGSVVNALCRVSDSRSAEALFDEMEAEPSYKPRAAPYNSMIQYFLTTKRDKAKTIAYYQRMLSKGISPTAHTFKLLIDAHATLPPMDLVAAEAVLDEIRAMGQQPQAVHYAALIHAKGCTMQDAEGALKLFDQVLADPSLRTQSCVYQALCEALVANHRVPETDVALAYMQRNGVEMSPYIANSLIHGWAKESNISKSRAIYDGTGASRREPSTYESMVRAYLAVEMKDKAMEICQEMIARHYPAAVESRVTDIVGGRQAVNAYRTDQLSGQFIVPGTTSRATTSATGPLSLA